MICGWQFIGSVIREKQTKNQYRNIIVIATWSVKEHYFLFVKQLGLQCFNATFSNISVIPWRSVKLMEETDENNRTARWLLCEAGKPYIYHSKDNSLFHFSMRNHNDKNVVVLKFWQDRVFIHSSVVISRFIGSTDQ